MAIIHNYALVTEGLMPGNGRGQPRTHCKGQTHPREKGCNNEGGEGVINCKMYVLA